MLIRSSPPATRHSPLEKPAHSSHAESALFKQPPPLEPPMSSPAPSLRDPPWPHGGTPPGRPAIDRSPNQRKDSSLGSLVPSNRVPRPYNKVASSEYRGRAVGRFCHLITGRRCSGTCHCKEPPGFRSGACLRR